MGPSSSITLPSELGSLLHGTQDSALQMGLMVGPIGASQAEPQSLTVTPPPSPPPPMCPGRNDVVRVQGALAGRPKRIHRSALERAGLRDALHLHRRIHSQVPGFPPGNESTAVCGQLHSRERPE